MCGCCRWRWPKPRTRTKEPQLVLRMKDWIVGKQARNKIGLSVNKQCQSKSLGRKTRTWNVQKCGKSWVTAGTESF